MEKSPEAKATQPDSKSIDTLLDICVSLSSERPISDKIAFDDLHAVLALIFRALRAYISVPLRDNELKLLENIVLSSKSSQLRKIVYLLNRARFPGFPAAQPNPDLDRMCETFQKLSILRESIPDNWNEPIEIDVRNNGFPSSFMDWKRSSQYQNSPTAPGGSRLIDPFETDQNVNKITILKRFTSQARPLLLRFSYAVVGIRHAIFKVGDDLRQDYALHILFRVFNSIWKSADLGVYTPEAVTYQVIPLPSAKVGNNQDVPMGLLECISEPQSTLDFDWASVKQEDRMRLLTTMAGGWMAAYAVDLGDRHQDNMMISNGCEFVPIDFGHMLGYHPTLDARNFALQIHCRDELMKWKASHMRGAQNGFECFVHICQDAFELLRRHAGLLLHLAGVLFDGINNHTQASVRTVMLGQLMLNLSSADAAVQIAAKIQSDIVAPSTQLKLYLHELKQAMRAGTQKK